MVVIRRRTTLLIPARLWLGRDHLRDGSAALMRGKVSDLPSGRCYSWVYDPVFLRSKTASFLDAFRQVKDLPRIGEA